jgi:hypothetical protein
LKAAPRPDFLGSGGCSLTGDSLILFYLRCLYLFSSLPRPSDFLLVVYFDLKAFLALETSFGSWVLAMLIET